MPDLVHGSRWWSWFLNVRRRWRLGLSPLTVPNLKFWVRADSLASLTDNAQVASWSDESGNGKHLAQATPSARPVFRHDADGRPVVTFDGVDDILATASNVLLTDRYLILVVARPENPGMKDLLVTGTGTNGDFTFGLGSMNTASGSLWRGANANTTSGTSIIHNAGIGILEVEADASQIRIRVNELEEQVRTLIGSPAGASRPVYLGARVSAWFWKGDVREVLIVEGNPSLADKARLRDYLWARHRLPFAYPPVPVPAAPIALAGSPEGSGMAMLTWDGSAVQYELGGDVQRKLLAQPDTSFASVGSVGPGEYEFEDIGGTPGTTVNYRVRAYNASGSSPWSNMATVTLT